MLINSTLYDQPEIAARLRRAFPMSLNDSVNEALHLLPAATFPPSPRDIGPVTIHQECIGIPSRIYAPEPRPTAGSNIIAAALYTRHNDGIVREKYLSQLIRAWKSESWIAPYILQLAGEYVIEIIKLILANVDSINRETVTNFAAENTAFIRLTRQRTISYWNCYYRHLYTQLDCYPGFKVLDELGLWQD